MPNIRELPDILEERKSADRVLDEYGALRPSYQEWHREITDIYHVYAGEWDVVWPDKERSRALPKIPNFIQTAAEDRARTVAATKPSILCRPDKDGDRSKTMAEKRERIIGGWWAMNRMHSKFPRWAMDAMSSGLTVCRVLPDFTKPKVERFPEYRRLEPAFCYPDPVFTVGPNVDSMVYAYEEKARTVGKRFGVAMSKAMLESSHSTVRVIEYYDNEQVMAVVQSMPRAGQMIQHEVLMQENHELEICPVVIGTRATMDGVYRSEFMGGLGIMNFWNRMMTLTLDDAITKVYAAKTYYDIENPEEWGPDALLEKQTPQGSFEYVQPSNAPFTNIQLLHDLAGYARAGVLMPPSRSGDPNESIISAAGVTATQSQFLSDVSSIQSDIIAPMLEAANEIAMKGDEQWADVPKTIYGEGKGTAYKESYQPSKDINGCYRNQVVYGLMAAVDPINNSVMSMQQLGAGIIARRTAMENSPYITNSAREEKQRLKEAMQEAMIAGLQQEAAQGALTSQQLAEIDKLLSDDSVSLSDAIAQVTPAAALAPPQAPPTNPGAAQAPGLAGAQEGQSLPQNLPSLADLGVRRAGG